MKKEYRNFYFWLIPLLVSVWLMLFIINKENWLNILQIIFLFGIMGTFMSLGAIFTKKGIMKTPFKISEDEKIQMLYNFFVYLSNAIICFVIAIWLYINPIKGDIVHFVLAVIVFVHTALFYVVRKFFNNNTPGDNTKE